MQAQLLEEHMRDLRRVIRPGAKRLNWNSLGISDFIIKCDAVGHADLAFELGLYQSHPVFKYIFLMLLFVWLITGYLQV